MNRSAIRFKVIVNRLDLLYRKGLKAHYPKYRELFLSCVIVKLHDQWNYRSRQIICDSYGDREAIMMRELRNKWTSKNLRQDWEPDWHMTANSIRAASLLQLANKYQIQNALGAVTYIDDLRWTRNAIVHNIPNTFNKYRRMALNKYQITNMPPHELIAQVNPITNNSIYEDWCNEMIIALSSARSA
jgi:UDP-N-acetylmuramyl tripeptide synthase